MKKILIRLGIAFLLLLPFSKSQAQCLPSIPAISGPQTVCQSDFPLYSVPLISGITYTWQVSGGGNIFNFPGQTNAIGVSFPQLGGPYTVTVTASSSTCGTGLPTTLTDIYVVPLPQLPVINGPNTACIGTPFNLTLTNTNPSFTYTWYDSPENYSITVNGYTATVTLLKAGSFNIRPNVSGGGCANIGSNLITSSNPPNTFTYAGPTDLGNLCSKSSLIAPAGYTYQWKKDGIDISGATTQTLELSSASGIYSVIVSTLSSCSTEITIPQSTFANRFPIMVHVNGVLCPGQTAQLNAICFNPNATYQWNLNGVPIPGATQATYAVSIPGNYNVTATNSNACSQTSITVPIIMQESPPATITHGTTSFCEGGSVQLNAVYANNLTYQWKLNGSNIPDAHSYYYTAAASGNYTVAVTRSDNCSQTSDIVPVTVNPRPSPNLTLSGPTTFCQGDSVILYAPEGATYEWWINGFYVPGITGAAHTVKSSGTYTARVTTAYNCVRVCAPVSVNVNATPSTTITANGPITFCSGGIVRLRTNTSAASYQWKVNGENITGANSSFFDASTPGNYSLTTANTNGCSYTSNTIVVTVHPNPSAVLTPQGPTTFCQGNSVTLTVPTSATYQWRRNTGSITGAASNSYLASESGDYSVIVQNTFGCSSTSNIVTVASNQAPVTSVSGSRIICGGSTTLAALSGYSYLWSTGETTRFISVSTPDTYWVTVTHPSSCLLTSEPIVVTDQTPTIAVSGPLTLCSSSATTLTSSPGAAYQWQRNGQSTGQTTQSITPTTSGTYHVLVTNPNGCISSTVGSNTVTIQNGFDATIRGQRVFCEGGNTILTHNTNEYYNYTYAWSNGYTSVSTFIDTPGNYNVTITHNITGCTVTSPTVTVAEVSNTNGGFIIPNANCFGDTQGYEGTPVTFTAYPAGASYAWYKEGTLLNFPSTAQSIAVSARGNYTVTAVGINGTSNGCFDLPSCPPFRIGTIDEPEETSLPMAPHTLQLMPNLTTTGAIITFPNPADAEVTIQLPEARGSASAYYVFNTLGHAVSQGYIEKNQTKKTISTQDLKPGLYLIKISGEGSISTQKVTIAHTN